MSTLSDYMEVEDEEQSQGVTVTFLNPEHEDNEPDFPRTLTDEQYQAVRTIRHEYGVELKELVGEFFRALHQAKKTEVTTRMHNLGHKCHNISKVERLTNWDYGKKETKQTSIRFRNARHPENSDLRALDVEHKWYDATEVVRDVIGTSVYDIIGDFCLAVQELVEDNDPSRMIEMTQDLSK